MTRLRKGVIDYRGRSVDLLAFTDEGPSRPSRQELVSETRAGAVTTGISKLVQRVLLELLTDKGSLAYLPDRGSLLMLQLRAGILRTSADLFTAFSSAATDVVRQLRLEETEDDSPDERIESLEMLSANLFGDKGSIRAEVRSLAGESRDLFIPLDVSPTPLFNEST